MLILAFLLAIGATSSNIVGGYAGYISLGNSAFVGLGAYATGILAAKDNVSRSLAASSAVSSTRSRRRCSAW